MKWEGDARSALGGVNAKQSKNADVGKISIVKNFRVKIFVSKFSLIRNTTRVKQRNLNKLCSKPGQKLRRAFCVACDLVLYQYS